MKKLFLLAIVALSAMTMSAQSIMRAGNTYYVDGMSMKKAAFAMHMQQNAEANLAMQFQNALKLSNTGWGLFGAGLGTSAIGGIVSLAGTVQHYTQCAQGADGETPVVTSVPAATVIGALIAAAGEGLTIAGIVCLGVGYSRMHNTADMYAYSQRKTQAYLSLKANQNGLGLALNF